MIAVLAFALAATLTGALSDARIDAIRMARDGEYAEALRRFESLLAANETDVEAAEWIGRIYSWMGDQARAEEQFRRLLVVEPGNTDLQVGLATVLTLRGRYDDALAALNSAIESRPGDAAALAARGRVFRLLGRTSLAVQDYERAAALEPGDRDIRDALFRVKSLHAHRVEASYVGESFGTVIRPTRAGDVAISLRLQDRLRISIRQQVQDRFDRTESRTGGGAEWLAHPGLILRAEIIAGAGTRILPGLDTAAEASYSRGRVELVGGSRFVRFPNARVMVLAPGATLWLSDRFGVSARYFRSVTAFDGRSGLVPNDSVFSQVRFRPSTHIWITGGFARGVERFEMLSADRLGRFQADTVSSSVRIDLHSLTSISLTAERQWRSGGLRVFGVTTAITQRF